MRSHGFRSDALLVFAMLWHGCSAGNTAMHEEPASTSGGAGATAEATGGTPATKPAAAGTGGTATTPIAGTSARAGADANAAGSVSKPTAGTGAAAGSGGAPGSAGQPAAAGTAGAPQAGSMAPPATSPGGHACHSTADWTPAASDIWVAPTGSDTNPGTEASPKQTLTAAVAAWSAGKTIWVMPGDYAYSSAIALSTKASADAPLRISGISTGAMPVFDFSSEPRSTGNGGQRGIELSGSHVHVRYLELKKAADNCVYVTGTDNTLEWLSVHECQDTGVQVSNGAASNKVLNVDSYLNTDPSGENADGFAPKLSIGQNNYFCGTRAYHNADDGYDCWASGDSSPVKFEYCWAFGQPGPTATANGDGNGFKLGSPAGRASGGNAPHELIDCYAFHNRSAGYTANGNSSGKITCENCGEWGNGVAWSSGTGGKDPQHTGDITNLGVTVEQAINAPRDQWGDLPDISKL